MFSEKTIIFLSLIAIGHCIFAKNKHKLLDGLQVWWHEFLELATNYISEDEINERLSNF